MDQRKKEFFKIIKSYVEKHLAEPAKEQDIDILASSFIQELDTQFIWSTRRYSPHYGSIDRDKSFAWIKGYKNLSKKLHKLKRILSEDIKTNLKTPVFIFDDDMENLREWHRFLGGNAPREWCNYQTGDIVKVKDLKFIIEDLDVMDETLNLSDSLEDNQCSRSSNKSTTLALNYIFNLHEKAFKRKPSIYLYDQETVTTIKRGKVVDGAVIVKGDGATLLEVASAYYDLLIPSRTAFVFSKRWKLKK